MAAAVSLDDCNVLHNHSGFHDVLIITPATMDANDTIDISALVQDGQLCGVDWAWAVDTGDAVTCTYAIGTGILTVDAGGGDTNHTYAIRLTFVDHTIVP